MTADQDLEATGVDPVDGEVDVLVLGAGFAGLAAAGALRNGGVAVRVLEARDRVGGRVYTDEVPGVPGLCVDLGGQWVGPTQSRLLHHIERHGLETFKTHTAGDSLVVIDGHTDRFRGLIPKLPATALANIAWAQWRLERMSEKVPLDEPWAAPRAGEWDRIDLGTWLDRNIPVGTAREVFELALEAVFAEEPRHMSLLHALFYIHSGDDLDALFGTADAAQDSRVVGGMQTVAEAMAQDLDVRFDSPVTHIAWGRHGVTVTGRRPGGGEFSSRASSAVLTLPPPQLARLGFTPALPADRAAIAVGSPMGAVVKCHAVYERPFWREEGLNGSCLSDRGPIHLTFDNTPHDGSHGVLVGFADADAGREMARLGKADRRQAALDRLAEYFGPLAAEPVAYLDKVWEHDEWSGGCYGAFCPPGLWTAYGHSMRKPVGPLHWAGTETAAKWSGYIDGAIASGERAAAEVLAVR